MTTCTVDTLDEEEVSTVHVVDDDESLRMAMTRLLRAAGYHVQSYASAGEYLLRRKPGMNGCLLLDVRMPGPSGLELQAALQNDRDALPIIFLTAHGDIPMSVQAMKQGAVDFLTKPVESKALLHAIKGALAKQTSETHSRRSMDEYRNRLRSLTEREHQVFVGVVSGKLNKQIAADLGTVERTVKAHRSQVMTKMQATSLADLVHMADTLRAAGYVTE
ncbi:LuxR family two component transcriptional regulator [Roseimicrobium gellanilyticum]|uniref:LuxR family two component transcriptional regulator n=1 Tax=Roseimicrobium gellanilyticum TaxID=748857 RepID=A0A366H0W6_9BACT|nr:response regulator [Roseimicrobium gellanilyticum]RBP35344.1 LuxR family two component transcriptional regulator [Roseimicrobium gellanilyticum]